jgi:trk system potassium uptake protein TrkH
MFYRDILKILGLYLFGLSAVLLLPLTLAIYFEFFADPLTHPQPHSTYAFLETLAICLGVATLFYSVGKHTSGHLHRKEGLAAVVLVWLLTPAIGALPFYFSNTLQYIPSYFEAVSGLTTTGSTIMSAKKYNKEGEEIPVIQKFLGTQPKTYVYFGTITPVRDTQGRIILEGVEAVSLALLFWRSFMQWLGGLGVVVLFVAILPLLGVGGKLLFQAEMPGPLKDSLTPRIKETASLLWKIYLALTIFQITLLLITNEKMSFFEAVCMTFSTVSTGGFSIKNESLGGYHNLATDWVTLTFMLLGSINFSIYFYAIKKQLYRAYEPELFLYLALITLSCWFATYSLYGTEKQLLTETSPSGVFTFGESIRYGFFQMISAQTSTGFATANYDIWPYPVQVLMIITMYIGGMAGSTAGGAKVIRTLLIFKIVQYRVESIFRRESVRILRIQGKEIDVNAAMMVLSFFVILVTASLLSMSAFIFNGIDPETSIGLTSSMINNCGLAFRAAGPMGSLGFLSNFDMIHGAFIMILGRLEFYAVLALLVPAFWKET